jgi:hypothetical protein
VVPVVPVALRALLVVTVVIARFQTVLRPLQPMVARVVLDRTGQTPLVVPVEVRIIRPIAQSSTVVAQVVPVEDKAVRVAFRGGHL